MAWPDAVTRHGSLTAVGCQRARRSLDHQVQAWSAASMLARGLGLHRQCRRQVATLEPLEPRQVSAWSIGTSVKCSRPAVLVPTRSRQDAARRRRYSDRGSPAMADQSVAIRPHVLVVIVLGVEKVVHR